MGKSNSKTEKINLNYKNNNNLKNKSINNEFQKKKKKTMK